MNPNGAPGPTPVSGDGTTSTTPSHPATAATAGATRRHCAALSWVLAEPLAATAPPGDGSWLAVEHAGPWPRRATDAGLHVPAADAVLREAAALGIRAQLIRRSGRYRPTPPRHTVLVASNRGREPFLERTVLDDLGGLRELDLTALADGRAPGFGAPSDCPELLVCTHGRRDVCCARHGRPVAATMRAAHPGSVWETTHLGGDRFAANVACLPHGTYHGRVTARTATAVAAACLAGEVHLPHYRGRAGQSGAAQAAEHAVRLATGLVRLDAVTVEAVDHLGCAALVRLRVDGLAVAVPVRAVPAGPPRPTSCTGCTLETPTLHVTGAPYRLPGAPHGRATGGNRRDYRFSG